MKDSREQLLDLYRCMAKIRAFEDGGHTQFLAGAMPGFLHLCSGEEAVAAGVMAVLRDDGLVTSTHRGNGRLVAQGGDVNLMMGEIFGRATGYCKGKGGSMRVADVKLGVLGANGVVGAGIPIGTGAALTRRFKREGAVSVTFFRGPHLREQPDGVANCQREHMNICDIVSA